MTLRWRLDADTGQRWALAGTYRLTGSTLAFDEWYVIASRYDGGGYEASRVVVAFGGRHQETTWRSMQYRLLRDARHAAQEHADQVEREGVQRW